MMKKWTLRQGSILLLLILLLLGVGFYAVAHEQMCRKTTADSGVLAEASTAELLAGDAVEQTLEIDDDCLHAVSLLFQTFGRTNEGRLDISLWDGDTLLYTATVDAAALEDNAYASFSPELSGLRGRTLTLRVESPDGRPGSAVALAYGSGARVGRGVVPRNVEHPARLNGEPLGGQLCLQTLTEKTLWFGQYYWYLFAGALLLCALYLLKLNVYAKEGKTCRGLQFLQAMRRYRFLLEQLVDRDFKTKYKRSVLGAFWSVLNPLLTMLVQYLVFSTLFKGDIPHYPAYLLTGIVCFTFFSEASSQCMMSIVSNASLITKVYVPKYIFPLSKSLSAGINLLLSMLPLLLVTVLTGLWPRPALLLLPFGLLCLFVLTLGLGLLLATSMVFFRDTQFLWSVVSMLWMYATPIFYPESIIPAKLMGLYKLNPLYHIIRFCRVILIDGVSPEPKAYLFAAVACVVPLVLGLWVFKRKQDRFVLYV